MQSRDNDPNPPATITAEPERLEVEIEAASGARRKRKRSWAFDQKSATPESIVLSEDEFARSTACKTAQRIHKIAVPQLKYPKSIYTGHQPPATISNETEIIRELLAQTAPCEDPSAETFIEADLEDFCVYRAYQKRRQKASDQFNERSTSDQFVSLTELNEFNVDYFYFDGLLSFGEKRYYVQRASFRLLSIGGFEDLSRTSVGGDLWIQSDKGRKSSVWYRLGKPACDYERYQEHFLWTADLAKHVIDFIHAQENVRLSDFQRRFYDWLVQTHPEDDTVSAWLSLYADTDFRRAISRQAIFLYSQAIQLDKHYYRSTLWADVHPRDLTFIPEQVEDPNLQPEAYLQDVDDTTDRRRKTTVTPYVYECFKHLPWSSLLYTQGSTAPTLRDVEQTEAKATQNLRNLALLVKVGDVVAILPDQKSCWKTSDSEWLALVQGIDQTPTGEKLSILWIYRPRDTACMKMQYPHPREVFLSDHCNCGDPSLYAHEIVRKPSVAFFGQPGCAEDFFCRQQYREADAAWTSLNPSHFRCPCRSKKTQAGYKKGQTVLFKHSGYLRPAIVHGNNPDDDSQILVRQLLFRNQDLHDLDAAPNELVYTHRILSVKIKRIVRTCNIRFIPESSGPITVPYNRAGLGDFFYLRSRETADRNLEELERDWPADFLQGIESLKNTDQRPLKALDLFCGGGNFARGLEDAGAVKCHWAVDYFSEAIHTYSANMSADSFTTKLFRGSVNHFLGEALDGQSNGGLIPGKGEVDVIVAGSPCQGFSMANPRKGNIPGLLNESLVASVVSFVDFYRPKYVLLENVRGMAMGRDDQNVLAAVLCAVVSMGYQAQTYLLDAWCFGSPQSRSRIFISCAAPGLPVLIEPPPSHSHPPWVRAECLGRTANGLQTSARNQVPTPFAYVSAGAATKDLPESDHTLGSIRYPDHREARALGVIDRIRIASIPRYPEGAGFLYACAQGLMPQPQVDCFSWANQTRAGQLSKVWTRIRKDRLFPTIQTAPRPHDGLSGNILHWDEHRLLTILEARRAQGFLDQDVILGSVADQWKIVGNSVARPVAFALGLALREAWLSEPSLLAQAEGTATMTAPSELATFYETPSQVHSTPQSPPVDADVKETWQSPAQHAVDSLGTIFNKGWLHVTNGD